MSAPSRRLRRFAGERKTEAMESLECAACGVSDPNTEDCVSLSPEAWSALSKLTISELIHVEAWLREVRAFNTRPTEDDDTDHQQGERP